MKVYQGGKSRHQTRDPFLQVLRHLKQSTVASSVELCRQIGYATTSYKYDDVAYEHARRAARVALQYLAVKDAYDALGKIVKWSPPPVYDGTDGRYVSYSLLYGSSGVRDYFRNVACDALGMQRVGLEPEPRGRKNI